MRHLLLTLLGVGACYFTCAQSKWGFSIVIVSKNGDSREKEYHYYSETIDLSKLDCTVPKVKGEPLPDLDVRFYTDCLSNWFYNKTQNLNGAININEMSVTSFVKKTQGKIDPDCPGSQITCFYTKRKDVERIRRSYIKNAERGGYKVVVVK